MRTFFFGLAVAALAPGAAMAKDLPAGGLTLHEIVDWLVTNNLSAEVEVSKAGVENIAVTLDGTEVHIYQFDCDHGRCASLQFSAGFNTKGAFSPGQMNDWNRDDRWSRAYVDKVNDPWLEMDVDLSPGGTYELLDDELATWRKSLGNFRKAINF